MPDRAANSDSFLGLGRHELHFNLRVHRQIRDGEQTHSMIADIDAQSFQASGFGEDADRGVEQLPLPAPPLRFEIAFQKH